LQLRSERIWPFASYAYAVETPLPSLATQPSRCVVEITSWATAQVVAFGSLIFLDPLGKDFFGPGQRRAKQAMTGEVTGRGINFVRLACVAAKPGIHLTLITSNPSNRPSFLTVLLYKATWPSRLTSSKSLGLAPNPSPRHINLGLKGLP
jgi:hypothetical protein